VAPGLRRLRERFRMAPCSNGNISLMVDLARRNGLHWDAILGAELARDYKPQPVVYLTAAAAFDCAPHEVLMVAAHSSTWPPPRPAGCAPRTSRGPTNTAPASARRRPACRWTGRPRD
jgi:2-haloacid dehalogenase